MLHRITSLFLTVFVLAGITSCHTSSFFNGGAVLGDSLWIKGVEDILYKKNVEYLGELTPEKRFVSLGFDDFRASDFSLVIPILNKYDAKAVFNRIHFSADVTEQDREHIQMLIDSGHELGDHTWRHFSFIFDEPLFNGQDPDHLDGNQVPFPSNSQLREDAGGGKNVFGHLLTDSIKVTIGSQAPNINTTWGNLSDDECQYFREYFSVMKDKKSLSERLPFIKRFLEIDDNTDLIDIFDQLSNMYLGTSGSSNGSWSDEKGCYEGGIFTGCRTSANHEIWERVLLLTKMFIQDKFGIDIHTWSCPGGTKASRCLFPLGNLLYLDNKHQLLFNNLARFTSSVYRTNDGDYKSRSWTDVLKRLGYLGTHDATFPGRRDGQVLPCMSYQYIMNASQSRPDALIYPTNRTIDYRKIANEFVEGVSLTGDASLETQMYDAGGSFHDAIESWRMHTANGMIWGEVIDSEDTWSENVILEGLLKYGKVAGIEFVTKDMAYDICFNHSICEGNLIYNPNLRNTAKEFLPDAKTVPTNPDGYSGDCWVDVDGRNPVLITNDITTYDHYGIPYGKICYEADIKGCGSIKIRVIKNNTAVDAICLSDVVVEKRIDSPNSFSHQELDLLVPDNSMTSYEQLCAGWGDKIIGLRLDYSGGLYIKNIKMYKK